jgi:hypothetical protein
MAYWFGTKFRVFFSSAKWFGMEFRAFYPPAKKFETEFRFFFFRSMTRNGIPSIFRSAEQTELRRNKSKFPSLPCSEEFFFLGKWQTYPQVVVLIGIFYLKVLSSEMDPAEIRLIRWDFFKGIVASGF